MWPKTSFVLVFGDHLNQKSRNRLQSTLMLDGRTNSQANIASSQFQFLWWASRLFIGLNKSVIYGCYRVCITVILFVESNTSFRFSNSRAIGSTIGYKEEKKSLLWKEIFYKSSSFFDINESHIIFVLTPEDVYYHYQLIHACCPWKKCFPTENFSEDATD